jgi:hypothetical protein
MNPKANKTTKAKSKKAAKLSKPMKKAVEKIVHGSQETKFNFTSQPTTIVNSAITNSTTEWYNPIPPVRVAATTTAGAASYERSGVRIDPTALKMTWNIGFGSSITRSCDNLVVLYVFKYRLFRSSESMQLNGDPGSLLDQGAGGVIGFTGYLQQLMTPVNRDRFILIKKKIFHLQKGTGALNNATGDYSGNGNKSNVTYSLTLKPPRFVYDEGEDVLWPNNWGLVWCIGYAHADGTAPDSILADHIVTQTSQLYYKDS